jgi:hypothetical protein
MNKTLTRTICIKLDVNGHDAILAATQRACNAAASWIAQVCWEEGITNTNTAHHRVYGETRLNFSLGAQLAVCARAKTVEAIKAMKAKRRDTCPYFGPHGSIRYDARTYRLMSLDRVSLNTLDGRVVCRLVLGPRQHTMLMDSSWEVGGADLVWRRGTYYLHLTQRCEASLAAEPTSATLGVLGVDLGIVNLATDSEGADLQRRQSASGPETLSYPSPTVAESQHEERQAPPQKDGRQGSPLSTRYQSLHQQNPGE